MNPNDEWDFKSELVGQEVTYYLYQGSECNGTPVFSDTVTVLEGGVIPDSDLYQPLEDGIYNWQVVYGGEGEDGNFLPAHSICGSETVVVGAVEIDIQTTMRFADGTRIGQGETITIGSTVYDTTSLIGANNPTGTATYTLVRGDSCGNTETVYGPETVTLVDGQVPPSSAYTPEQLGTYHWIVEYSGDGQNQAVTSPCGDETFVVGPAQPQVTTVMMNANTESVIEHGDSVTRGTQVYDTATMTGFYGDAPVSGTVTYTLYRGSCPGGTVVDSIELPVNPDGTLPDSPVVSADVAGTYNWVVSYSGDDFNAPAVSPCGSETFNVTLNPTTIETVPQLQTGDDAFEPIALNGVVSAPADVRDTAVVTGLTDDATGSVTYTLYRGSGCGGEPVAGPLEVALNQDGTVPPSPVVEDLTPGQYNWVAVYSGDDNNLGSAGTCGDEQFFVTGEGQGGYVRTDVVNADTGTIVPDGGTVPLGTTVFDTAEFFGSIVNDDGTAAVSGTIVYSLYSGDECVPGSVVEGQGWSAAVVAGQPVPDMPDSIRLTEAGTYNFQAVFTPEGGAPIASPCGTETVIVAPLTPAITTHILDMGNDGAEIAPKSAILRPASVADSVTVQYLYNGQPVGADYVEGLPLPTGTLTYTLYNDSGCEDAFVEPIVVDVEDGVFGQSDTVELSESHFGVFNWVVTFESADGNYTNSVSRCGQETFFLQAQPALTTEMFESDSGDGEGTVLPNGGTVTVGDWVRDTGTLTGFADGATGKVTFRLHQGSDCSGPTMFSDTVTVTNGVVESTDWYQIRLSGPYSWSASYTGDINGQGGFTRPAESDCSTETFFAEPVPADPTMVTVMRNGNTIIPHLNYVAAPINATDEAIFTNLDNRATGNVTYQLYKSVDCDPSTLVHTSVKTVVNWSAPISDPFSIQASDVPANGQIYSWVVTFEGTGDYEGVTAESPCGEEQFAAFTSVSLGARTSCTFNRDDNTMSFTVYLNPRDVNDENETPVVIRMQPRNLDLSPADSIVIENPEKWVFSYDREAWRRVDGTVEWNGGSSRASFSVRCLQAPYSPELTTTMYRAEDDSVLSNDDTVQPGTVVYDTTQLVPGTSTVIMSGTLTYELLRGANCETAETYAGPFTTAEFTDVPIDGLPTSNEVTVTEPGTYWWVVTYNPPASQGSFPDNRAATSECGAEFFNVAPFDTTLTTLIVTENGSSTTAATGETVYDTATLSFTPEVQTSVVPTGTVTYYVYEGRGDDVCVEGNAVDSFGPYSLNADGTFPNSDTTSFLTAGDYEFQAVYSGDGNFDPATSACGSEPLTITAPELTIEKTATNETISAGDPIVFSIVVTNPGPGVATGVTLTDALPTIDGVTWTFSGPEDACTLGDDGVLSCDVETLSAGATLTVQVTGTTTAESCGEVENTASFATENANRGDDDATVTILCPDVVVDKTSGAGTVSSGDPISFTMTVTNTGQGNAYDVQLTDTLPMNAGLAWTIDPEADGCVIADGVLTCAFGTLASGASQSVTITSTTSGATCGVVENDVAVFAGNEPENNVDEDNEDSASVTVLCPDVVIAKTTTTPSVNATDQVRFDIAISNVGEGTAYDVEVSDVLPAGLTWSLVAEVGGCQLITDEDTGAQEITCFLEAMEPGSEFTISVIAQTSYEACGTYENVATISAENEPEGNGDNNSSEATVVVLCSDVQLTKVADVDEISAGDTIGFTITMVNNGDGVAYGAVLTDTLPTDAGLSWSIDPEVEGCTIDEETGVLTCEVGDLAPDASFTVRITSITTAETCGVVDNDAMVSFDNAPMEEDGDSVTVLCPDLSILKTAVEGTINATDVASFRIVITNAGPGVAYDVVVTDDLPTGITGWAVENEACGIEDGVLTCEFAEIAPNASQTIVVSSPTTLEMCGPHENIASVGASNEPDGNVGDDNESTATISVNCSDIDLQKVAERDEVSAGDEIAFTISMVNTGEGIAYDAILTDTLPTNVGLSWTIEPANDACVIEDGVLTCEVGDLAQGDEFSVRIESVTTAGTCGVVDNSAVVDFREGNTEPANASDQVTVLCPTPAIEKVADDGEVSAGDEIGFTITASNAGPGNAYDVVLTDTLPTAEGTEWIIAGGEGAEFCVITDEGVLECDFGTMAPESSWSVRLVSPTTYETCSIVSNTAEITLSNGDPVTSTDEVTVLCPDPVIMKIADQESVSAGDQIGFSITITNNGQGNAYGVRIADTLPTTPGTDWAIDGGDGAEFCVIEEGDLICDFGTMAEGASFAVHISSPTTAETCGVVDNTAVVNLSNAPSEESGATVTVNCPNVVIEKTAAPDTVSAGDDITFTLTVTNPGVGNAYDVVLTDTLPVVPGVEWTIAGGNGADSCVIEDGVVLCDFGTMAPNEILEVIITSPTTADSCAVIDNTATVSVGNEPGDVTDDNSSSAGVTVLCPDVSIVKTADAEKVTVGDVVSFSLEITNHGAGTAYDVVVTDNLPDGFAWTVSGDVVTCAIVDGILTCEIPVLEAGQTLTIVVSATGVAAQCGVIENVASVSAGNEPADAISDNEASASLRLTCPPEPTPGMKPGATPPPITELPSTGKRGPSSAATNIGMLVLSSLLLAGTAWTLRRREAA